MRTSADKKFSWIASQGLKFSGSKTNWKKQEIIHLKKQGRLVKRQLADMIKNHKIVKVQEVRKKSRDRPQYLLMRKEPLSVFE